MATKIYHFRNKSGERKADRALCNPHRITLKLKPGWKEFGTPLMTEDPCVKCDAIPAARARNTDPDTSHEAAQSLSKPYLGGLDVEIIDVLRQAGDQGATTAELQDLLPHRERVSVSPRMSPLEKKGAIKRSGQKRLNPRTNCQGVVWILNDDG